VTGPTTAGLVCGHHHLYSTLARGMPPLPRTPTGFTDVLELLWWRLDAAIDLDVLAASARLGALEALACGTTAIVDHHESPRAIDGSLDVIAAACAEVGVRVVCAYGVTDRWGDDGRPHEGDVPPKAMTAAAKAGLAECERFVRAGGRGMVGVHAAFTCSDETLDAAAGLAADLGVGVHVHVAEDAVDAGAVARLAPLATDDWLLAHCGHAEPELAGTVAHNPRSNQNNAVGYARPARWADAGHRVVLGTDGIGADMLEEFRLAFVAHRADDITATPAAAWSWLGAGAELVPEVAGDEVTWSASAAGAAGPGAPLDPWHLAFTTGVRAERVVVDGEVVLDAARATRVDADQVRAHAWEQARILWSQL
jgi:cytosine/adenosine deaminase-related metal-dependent hydrolase